MTSDNLKIETKDNLKSDEWAVTDLSKTISAGAVGKFISDGNKDLSIDIFISKSFYSIEVYKMVEVVKGEKLKQIEELEKLNKDTGSNIKIIKREFGENEKGGAVVIIGLSYSKKALANNIKTKREGLDAV